MVPALNGSSPLSSIALFVAIGAFVGANAFERFAQCPKRDIGKFILWHRLVRHLIVSICDLSQKMISCLDPHTFDGFRAEVFGFLALFFPHIKVKHCLHADAQLFPCLPIARGSVGIACEPVVSRIFRTFGWLSGTRPWLTR